jgi:DNA-binding NtrC family response regulator
MTAVHHVLLVEDDALIGLYLAQTLTRAGYSVVGPAASIASALAQIKLADIQRNNITAAIVDVRLQGKKSFPVMSALAESHIPFIVVSGYADPGLPPQFKDRPLVAKPWFPITLLDALSAVVAANSRASEAAL